MLGLPPSTQAVGPSPLQSNPALDPTQYGQPAASPQPSSPVMSIGGFMPVMNAQQVADQERKQAEAGQQQAPIRGLASYVRKVWTDLRVAKEQTVEQRMLSNLRVRRGEYDPEELAAIRKQGGSEIYMMIGSTKCRAAASWIKDVIIGVDDEKPWTLKPTPIPTLAPDKVEEVKAQATQMVAQYIMQAGGPPPPTLLRQMLEQMRDQMLVKMREEAQQDCDRMEQKMEDQLVEGGWMDAINDVIDDLTTFPTAFLKGPIVRKKPKLDWAQGPDGQWTPSFQDEITLEWERVSPFDIYPHPAMTMVNEPLPLIQRHRLTRSQLLQMKGVEGYDDGAIDAVLDIYGRNGLHDWLMIDTSKAQAEGRSTLHVVGHNTETIDALQFFGPVQGKMLLEWGMTEQDIPDPMQEYHCEVWLIAQWVIKATLNYDKLGRKPYYMASYEKVPGAFWGNSVIDLCLDSQRMCNSAARNIANNMSIASGPQAYVNVDRLPPGEDVTEMYPWKIWQTTTDMAGNTGAPVGFFQPSSNAQELMTIFQYFSVRADEDTGVPRYLTGESPTGGAGRTASGLSMLLGNASKAIKQVVTNIDVGIIKPVLERLYYYNMMYSDDPDLKGDINIVARGAVSIMLKEAAQQRRNEFLATVAGNPMLSQIVGQNGMATLLREAAKTLDMPNTDDIVPDPEKLRLLQALQGAAMQAQAARGQLPQPNTPTPAVPGGTGFQGGPGAQQAAPGGPSQSGQALMNGAPIVDRFSPPTQ